MDNQQAVVDQIVQNLAFDVEAVPKNKSMQSISKSIPLNVKIKVRKKDEIQKHHDVSWNADDTTKTVQKVRLVNSDRTIMSFDVFMEAEFEKKPRKLHKQLFDMLRPGICLGAVDDDKHPYMPSSSYSANITEPTKATKSDGTFKQTFTLSKNVYQDYSVSTQQREPKWLFGKCKPGGCLDPPFSEDKYSYKPSTRSGPEREEEEELLDEENVGPVVDSNKKPIILHDEESQSNGRHSSIFDSGLFKKKRRSSDKSTNTKLPDKTDSIVDIYHGESSTNSASTRSNSIITYPPKTKSDQRMSDDKTVRSRGPSEDKPRKSFNDHSEPYFIPPKGVNRIKEQDTLHPSDHPKHESSDVTKLRHPSEKESFKAPVSLPVPIPVPIPIMPSTRKPEDIDSNEGIGATQGDNANVTELPKQKSQEQESLEKMNLRDSSLQLLRKKSATGNIDDKPMEPSNIESFSSNVEQPTAPSELGDKNMDESKLRPFEIRDSENNMEETGLPNKNEKIESSRMPMPVPIPIPVPFNLSDPTAAAMDSETKNENLKTSDMNLAQSKQSFETPIIKDFVDSKDMQKNIDPENRSIENELTSNATSKSQYSDIEANEIPKDYLRTKGGFSDQESDTENQENDTVTKLPAETREKRDSKVEEITESNDKPTKQNDIKNEDTAGTKDEPKKAERKDSQRISQSKLPILQKSMSLLSGSKSSTVSAKDKGDTKRGDSPDKHSDKVGDKGTDLGSLLSGSKTSTASAKDNRDTKRSFSPDKYLDNVGGKDTDSRSLLSGSKTSTASPKDNRDTKRSFSPDKYLDNVGGKDTDLGSLLSGSKTSTASARDTKRSFSPDKYLDNIGDEYTDVGSLLSGSKTSTTSAKDNRDKKRSFSPDKYLDNVGDRDTDLGVRKDEKRTSLPSAPKHETDSGDGKIAEPRNDKEYVGEITEPNNVSNIDSYTKGEARFPNVDNVNFIAAPVIIDNTKPSLKSGKLKEVDSETKILGEPMNIDREYDPSVIPFTTQIASTFRDGDDETHSTVSRELIGTQSVIYDTDELIPSTSAQKRTERIPSILSTSTLKSAMKKDVISVDLGFHSYLNDKNERILRTFDTANAPTRLSNDSVTVLKTQIRISSNEIRIPVDSEHDMSIQIRKSIANQRVCITENDIDTSKVKQQRSPMLSSDAEMRSSEANVEERQDGTLESDATEDHFTEYYEQELVPLQIIIKNLRNEIDVLAAQQVVFKDKLFCPNNALFAQNKSKLPRLVHSNKKCYGCVRK